MTRSPLDDTSAAPLSATESYANFVRNNYFSVSARVLFLWDYCLTIDREVQYIWNSKASPASALFLINRYANLLITIMELLEQGSFQTAKSCGPFIRILESMLLVVSLIAAAFATLRIYAIWDCDWRPALPVGMLGLASFALNILIYANQTTEKAPAPSTGCAAEIRIPYYRYHQLLFATQAMTVAYDAIALVLTIVKTVQIRRTQRHTRTSILKLLVTDGTLYFFTFFSLNLASTLVTAEVAGDNVNYVGYYVAPVTSLMISHFLLKLREVSQQQDSANRSSVYLTSYIWTAGEASDAIGMTSLAGPLGKHATGFDDYDQSYGRVEGIDEPVELLPVPPT